MAQTTQSPADSACEKGGALMDSILKFMHEHKIPLTRENYLDVAYTGTPPEELDPEEEAMMPEQFQKWNTIRMTKIKLFLSTSVRVSEFPVS